MNPLLESLQQRFPLATSQIQIGDWQFELFRPADPDALISEQDFDRDGRLPYWADTWPSATAMAHKLFQTRRGLPPFPECGRGLSPFPAGTIVAMVAEEKGTVPFGTGADGRRLLELGCGLGLAALAAIRAGFEVVATDYYDEALEFTQANACHNGLVPPTTRLVDWRRFPADLGRFDLVVASDVLFERPNVPLVAAAYARTIAPGGRGWLTDPGRPPAAAFPAECERHGLRIVERCEIEVINPRKPAAEQRQMIHFLEVMHL